MSVVENRFCLRDVSSLGISSASSSKKFIVSGCAWSSTTKWRILLLCSTKLHSGLLVRPLSLVEVLTYWILSPWPAADIWDNPLSRMGSERTFLSNFTPKLTKRASNSRIRLHWGTCNQRAHEHLSEVNHELKDQPCMNSDLTWAQLYYHLTMTLSQITSLPH